MVVVFGTFRTSYHIPHSYPRFWKCHLFFFQFFLVKIPFILPCQIFLPIPAFPVPLLIPPFPIVLEKSKMGRKLQKGRKIGMSDKIGKGQNFQDPA